ncbi:hypothetical protein TNCV_3685101 [Trichonephila clavipes]|uniref:Uncharacterized protein n=1 Tax=Trichonephila clavipes TaxID=2585209 RepID=A0A8X6V185_TRICX|nr:hypothetical protein TNCV_3685101 [Trichonephila clavipes]
MGFHGESRHGQELPRVSKRSHSNKISLMRRLARESLLLPMGMGHEIESRGYWKSITGISLFKLSHHTNELSLTTNDCVHVNSVLELQHRAIEEEVKHPMSLKTNIKAKIQQLTSGRSQVKPQLPERSTKYLAERKTALPHQGLSNMG